MILTGTYLSGLRPWGTLSLSKVVCMYPISCLLNSETTPYLHNAPPKALGVAYLHFFQLSCTCGNKNVTEVFGDLATSRFHPIDDGCSSTSIG